jgi:hypothetical protein
MNKTISIFHSFESHNVRYIDIHPKYVEKEKRKINDITLM